MPDGAAIRDAVLILAGNAFIIIFIIRTIGAYAKKEWGEMLVNLLAAVLIAGLVYSNESTMNMLKSIANLFLGG